MKSFVLLLLFALIVWVPSAGATTSLGFNDRDYSISMEIGHDAAPVVASLRVRTPHTPDGVFLHRNFTTSVFDVDRQQLSITYVQPEPGQQPGSFTLTVSGEEATLRIDGKVITGPFSWSM